MIEALVSNYKNIQFRAMKLATEQLSLANKNVLITEIYSLIDQQDEREFRIKQHLFNVFSQWSALHKLDLHGSQTITEEATA